MENKGNSNNNNNNGGNNNGGNNRNGMTVMIFILAALLVLFLTSLLNSCAKDATNKEITYSEFIDMVENDKVEEVIFTSNRIKIKPKSGNKLYRINYYTAELNDETLLPLLKEHEVKFGGTVEDVSSVILWNMVSYILPLVLVWVLLYFLIFRKIGGGGVMGVGKTTAKVYVEKSTGVTFKDVAGQDEAKESLQEVVDFLHNPKKYTDIGAKLPKGALLVGPPGTGKTLLAKAVAGEANVPFFSLAGSDFVEMFVGVGASRVRDLFKEAQKQAPCIIFIDEIDAIGKSRDTRYGGNDEREQTLNQLLAEMDGFDTSKGLLILAATNRPEVLDKALLRPGRFDRRIIVDKPDLKGRVETLKVHAKSVLMDDTVDLDAIALATSGAVGSDLANMINEAAINAVKQGRKYVNQSDLFESVEVVIAGKEKKDRIMGPKEKKMVAYHEVGHALVTALQKDSEPVQKITIVPRTMGALGYTMQVPEEEKFLMTKNELTAHLVTYMGGRAAEELVFESVTTGASNDIEQATKMARAMVTQYGMSEKFGLMGLVTVENQYLDGRASLNCGEDTAAQIDQEVMRILKESYDEAIFLLRENRDILDEIAHYLFEHETITGKEFMKIFRRLKGLPEPEEKTEAEAATEKFQVKKQREKDSAGRDDFWKTLSISRPKRAAGNVQRAGKSVEVDALAEEIPDKNPAEQNAFAEHSDSIIEDGQRGLDDVEHVPEHFQDEGSDLRDAWEGSGTMGELPEVVQEEVNTLDELLEDGQFEVNTLGKAPEEIQIEINNLKRLPEEQIEVNTLGELPEEYFHETPMQSDVAQQGWEQGDIPEKANIKEEPQQQMQSGEGFSLESHSSAVPEEIQAGVDASRETILGNAPEDELEQEDEVIILDAVSSQEDENIPQGSVKQDELAPEDGEDYLDKLLKEPKIMSQEDIWEEIENASRRAIWKGIGAVARKEGEEEPIEEVVQEVVIEEEQIQGEVIPQESEEGEVYLDQLLKGLK